MIKVNRRVVGGVGVPHSDLPATYSYLCVTDPEVLLFEVPENQLLENAGFPGRSAEN
jgi:hypothetical protein